MPRLLTYLTPAYNWLIAIDPSLPRALFVALVFCTVLLWRKVSPSTWLKFSSLIKVTEEDTSWFVATLRKAWQALPSALIGGFYGWLGTGGSIVASLKLALLGLLAPVVHELAWRYEGRLGTKRTPPADAQPIAKRDHVVFANPRDPEDVPPAALSAWSFLARQLRRRGLVMWAAAAVCLSLSGCALFAAEWPKLAEHCAPTKASLLRDVEFVLANTGDVDAQLKQIAIKETASAVECAVQQVVADLSARKGSAHDNHALSRGRAFLAKVRK